MARMRQFSTTLAALGVASAVFLGCGELTPEVGKCTDSDPERLVSLDVKVVECDSSEAKTKIVSKAKNASECKSGRLTFEEEIYCTEPK